jgi:hypothetical protein
MTTPRASLFQTPQNPFHAPNSLRTQTNPSTGKKKLPQTRIYNDEKYNFNNIEAFPSTIQQLLRNDEGRSYKGRIDGENICIYSIDTLHIWKHSLPFNKVQKCFKVSIENAQDFPFVSFVGKSGLIGVTADGMMYLWYNPFINQEPFTMKLPINSSAYVSTIHVFLVIFSIRISKLQQTLHDCKHQSTYSQTKTTEYMFGRDFRQRSVSIECERKLRDG